MKIVDAFAFFDEIDLLKIRLKTLAPIVDIFLISEFSTSFSGKPKDFNLEEHLSSFSEFSNKIIYIKQHQTNILGPFQNDHFQKDSLKVHLMEILRKEDILLFGDLDEIPNPQAVVDAINAIKKGTKICHFAQTISYSYLNMLDTSETLLSYCGEYPGIKRKKWLGTVATTLDYLDKFSMTELRDPLHKQYGERINLGGWHFSYAGGHKGEAINRIKKKIENNSHQELNTFEILSKVEERLNAKEDILGRETKKLFRKTGPQFQIVPIDSSFPIEVQLNLKQYKHLIHDYN
jgi:beta-1,4-mannosyl-glycoprotein beta-1,4-N-acetylglucosaminyltransferase